MTYEASKIRSPKVAQKISRNILLGVLLMTASDVTTLSHASPPSTTPKKTTEPLSILYIDNENNKDMDILIKPELIEDRSVDDTKRVVDHRVGEWVTARIPANSTIRLELPRSEIGNEVDMFSVTGETNPLTPLGHCYNLKMGRNYFLRFTDNAFGTDCLLTEMKKHLPEVSGPRIKIPYSRSKPHLAMDPEFAPNRPSQDSVSLSRTKAHEE